MAMAIGSGSDISALYSASSVGGDDSTSAAPSSLSSIATAALGPNE